MFIEWETPLSDEERELRDTVHRFAAEVMRPVGQRLDKMADPSDVIAPESELWEVFRRHEQLELGRQYDARTRVDPSALVIPPDLVVAAADVDAERRR